MCETLDMKPNKMERKSLVMRGPNEGLLTGSIFQRRDREYVRLSLHNLITIILQLYTMRNKEDFAFYPKGTISSDLAYSGLVFIRRRFQDVWNIFRSDIDQHRLINRDNMVLIKNSRIVGWLGLESDGELANSCIAADLNGVNLLTAMIQKIYRLTDADYYYAKTPIAKSGSARAFLNSGMHLANPVKLSEIRYPEKAIVLVRLEVYRSENPDFGVTPLGVERSLRIIREIN